MRPRAPVTMVDRAPPSLQARRSSHKHGGTRLITRRPLSRRRRLSRECLWFAAKAGGTVIPRRHIAGLDAPERVLIHPPSASPRIGPRALLLGRRARHRNAKQTKAPPNQCSRTGDEENEFLRRRYSRERTVLCHRLASFDEAAASNVSRSSSKRVSSRVTPGATA